MDAVPPLLVKLIVDYVGRPDGADVPLPSGLLTSRQLALLVIRPSLGRMDIQSPGWLLDAEERQAELWNRIQMDLYDLRLAWDKRVNFRWVPEIPFE